MPTAPTLEIVRINKEDGRTRLSNLAEVERIVHLNYHHPDQALQLFDEGHPIESPFAHYVKRPVKTPVPKEAS